MVFPRVLKVSVLRESGEKDNFLLYVGRSMEVCHKFDNLKNEIVSRYPELLQYEDIRFAWIDDEGDEITILNHADYFDFMDTNSGPSQKRRIFVRGINKLPQQQPQQQQQPNASAPQAAPMEQDSAPRSESVPPEDLVLHANIVCDVCDETIRGHRYKCMQCFNYDLCMRCETRFRHKDHIMVRIPTPEVNRRAPFRLFEKLRSFAAEVAAQPGLAAASDVREDEYENSKRSKRHHRRHSRDRDESKECREEKERKERKQRRERCAKSSEERRGGHRHRFGPGFNFSQLLNQVIDPANIQSAFISADAAAAAAAAAAESAEEAVRASMANCPLFASMSTTTSTTTSASASASASASTSAPTQPPKAEATATASDAPKQEASGSSPVNEEPQVKKAATSSAASPSSPKQVDMIDLSWLAPTPESIQKINQTISKMLDPLGMNIEIRANGAAPKPAQTQTPTEEKKDKTTETANTPTTSTPSQTPPGGAGTSSKATEMDPIVELEKKLEAVLMADPELEKKLENEADTSMTSDDDDCSSVSSVSLLSDNDDSVARSEKRWTLVDIPGDVEESSPKSTENVAVAAEATSPKVVEPVASTSSMPATPAVTATGSIPEAGSASSANNGTTSKPIDYEQLGKALKQHLEAEQQAAAAAKATATPPAPSHSPSPLPAVVVPVVQATPIANTVYSHKPHVNHAVHAMMAMGFSNEGAWLTQLLDSVNGDIPRALDLLTPHKINP